MVDIKLVTDFEDFYDDAFNNEGSITYERKRENEIPRKDLYKLIHKHRLIPPLHGKVKKFLRKLDSKALVIVYPEAEKHSGGEKLPMLYRDAYKKHEKDYMSLFIGKEVGESYTYVVVGEKVFFIKNESDIWNTNVNPKRTIEVVAEEDKLEFKPFNYPIYSIDLVHYEKMNKEWLIAIDFNQAPNLKELGLEPYLSKEEVVKQVAAWYQKKR